MIEFKEPNDYFNNWILSDAIELIKKIEDIAPEFGCHIALTGGLLYKDGPRKDLDIIVYRIRQSEKIDIDRFLSFLEKNLDITIIEFKCWLWKLEYKNKKIDLFFPDVYNDVLKQGVYGYE